MPAFKRNHLTLGTFPQRDVWPACHLIKYNVIVRLENVTLKKADEMGRIGLMIEDDQLVNQR